MPFLGLASLFPRTDMDYENTPRNYNVVLTLLLQLWLENRKTASYVSRIRFLHTPFYFHACIDNNNIFKMLTFLLLYLDVNAVMMNVIKYCWGICDTLID